MPLITSAKAGGKDWEPIPQGSHVARCVSVVDLGLQESTYQGDTTFKEKVYLGFEVPGVQVEWEKDGVKQSGPGLIGSTYTNSISDRAILGQHLVSWRGKAFTEAERKGFDLFNVLDVPCLISVTHKQVVDKTYANITAIISLPKGVDVPDRATDLLAYTPNDIEKAKNFDKLPEWLQKKCTAGHRIEKKPDPVDEYKSLPPLSDTLDDYDDSIPF